MNDALRHAVQRARDGFLDLVWPRRCAVATCRRPCDRPGGCLCSRCHAALPWHAGGGACAVCGALVADETRHRFVCETCAKKPPAFERAVSALRYVDDVPQLMHDFKYHVQTQLADDFAEMLEAVVREKWDAAAVDVVMPVPLHFMQLRERGYNQSDLIARRLAERLDRRFDAVSLVRKFDTEHQTRISGDARRTNLRHCFAVLPERAGWTRGRSVLLVDDVMTTGSTMDECARALVAAGARRVWCATVARAVR